MKTTTFLIAEERFYTKNVADTIRPPPLQVPYSLPDIVALCFPFPTLRVLLRDKFFWAVKSYFIVKQFTRSNHQVGKAKFFFLFPEMLPVFPVQIARHFLAVRQTKVPSLLTDEFQ